MIATWMLSVLLFTVLLAAAAWCAEVALRLSRRQARGAWLAAIVAAVTWPVLAPLARRVWPGNAVLNTVAVRIPGIRVLQDGVMASNSWLPSLDQLVVAVWFVVSLALLLRLWRALMTLSDVRAQAHATNVDGISVLVSPTIGPAVVGVVEPQILLPKSLLDLDEPLRRLVLRHEQEHRTARDQLIVVGSAVVLALFPWNLALSWIVRRARLALEIDCDMRVLSRGASANQYGKLLLFIAQRQSTMALAPMLAASTSHLERRIIAMHKPQPSRRTARVVVALLGMTVAVVAACNSDVADPVVKPTELSTPARLPAAAPEPYFEFQVEKVARQVGADSPLKYPQVLRAANVSGVVLAQFVVDTNGRVELGTFKALKSDHALFTQAVSDALPDMRFDPAYVGLKKVRQLVQQPFTFALSK
jgi:beta-lactamase regulating signal transducer with metallopeptidase domain